MIPNRAKHDIHPFFFFCSVIVEFGFFQEKPALDLVLFFVTESHSLDTLGKTTLWITLICSTIWRFVFFYFHSHCASIHFAFWTNFLFFFLNFFTYQLDFFVFWDLNFIIHGHFPTCFRVLNCFLFFYGCRECCLPWIS